MIIYIPKKLKKKTLLLIFNRAKELISIPQSLINYENYQKTNPKEIVAMNLVDKGYYLRKRQ